MKKSLLLSGFLTCLSFSSFAQTEKGSWLLGLSGNASFKTVEQNRRTSIQAAPLIGYFVKNNLALGTQLTLDHNRRLFMDQLNDKANTVSLHGMSRYYLGTWKARPYLNFTGGYTWNRALTVLPNGEQIRFTGDEGWNASLGAGLAYFVAPKVALEADANYRHYFASDLGREKNNAVTFRLGIALYLR